jgi:hypothetical protein
VLVHGFGSDGSVMVQYRPSSSFNGPQWSTNSGAPVWNNDNSLTVGPRGIHSNSTLSLVAYGSVVVSDSSHVAEVTVLSKH